MQKFPFIFVFVSSATSGLLGACSSEDSMPATAPGTQTTAGVFAPAPQSQSRYKIRPPSEAPELQRHFVSAADGTQLFIETWLPVDDSGAVAPGPLPSVLELTPYQAEGTIWQATAPIMERLVSHGYAFSVAHVRGTGRSSGCLGWRSPTDQDDAVRLIEYLGSQAPWSSGRVGMVGLSYTGGNTLMAATSDDSERRRYLKAIINMGGASSAYDFMYADGVQKFVFAQGVYGVYIFGGMQNSLDAGTDPAIIPQRAGCQLPFAVQAADVSGDVTALWRERDFRQHLDRIDAAVMLVHGLIDARVSSMQTVGLFERLPADIDKVGLFGFWDHEAPDDFYFNGPDYQSERFAWQRDDWPDMVTAWFDQHLLQLDAGVSDWPTVQVQGMDGEWRVEPDWPGTGGPAGQLALRPGGGLGGEPPAGPANSTYIESGIEIDGVEYAPSTAVIFATAPLPDRLQLSGLPVVDLWVSVDRPDAHLAAKLEAFDADGNLVIREARTHAALSLQHLEPLVENRFWQATGAPAPINTPMQVRLRFHPIDMVVPAGGELRLTIAGSTRVNDGLDAVNQGAGVLIGGPALPSLTATQVSLHHDCDHPSRLRFVMPPPVPQRLNVRERGETGPLQALPAIAISSDGGGLASGSICGQAPESPDTGQ